MTNIPLLYSDKKLPLEMKINRSDGKEIIFPDECHGVHFKEFSKDPYKDAVEQEIKVIRPALPEYDYYLSTPCFTDIQGNYFEDDELAMEQMFCINQFLKKVIAEYDSELFFLKVRLGDDYDCIDDIDFIKFNLNQSVSDLKIAYDRLYREWNIVQFIIEE